MALPTGVACLLLVGQLDARGLTVGAGRPGRHACIRPVHSCEPRVSLDPANTLRARRKAMPAALVSDEGEKRARRR